MNYGIPYMGSKNKIAVDIINALPPGKRFVDLFGGWFAMSHAALLSGKYDSIFYNDKNGQVVDLVRRAISGEFNYKRFKPEFVDRERFFAEKDNDPYIKYIWSFGNRGAEYMFSKKIEKIKKQGHDFCVFGKPIEDFDLQCDSDDPHERRLYLMRFVRKLNGSRYELQQLERLQELERLEQLEQLQRLEFSSIDYRDYQHKDGDVVYCDPPYKDTRKYCVTFDHDAFYEWVRSAPFPVYFSEACDLDFFVAWEKQKTSTYGTGNKHIMHERLYTNEKQNYLLR